MSLLRLFDVTPTFVVTGERERKIETGKYSLIRTLDKLETLFPDCMQSAERWLHFLITNRKTFLVFMSVVRA